MSLGSPEATPGVSDDGTGPLLLLRCDASAEIGVGHVMRCLALAEAWRSQAGTAHFLCAQIPDALRQRVQDAGFSVTWNEAPIGSQQDAAAISREIQQRQAAAAGRTKAHVMVVNAAVVNGMVVNGMVVVCDGYAFDEKFWQAVDRQDALTLLIDDYGQCARYDVDFVLNQNLGCQAQWYTERRRTTQLLLGSPYALLRTEFLQHPPMVVREIAERVLVTFGGSDPANATAAVVSAWQAAMAVGSSLRFTVVLGPAYPCSQALKQQIADDPRFEVVSDVRDMSALYRTHDLAVCAGGASNWEMCYFGLPRIVIPLAKNQELPTLAMEQAGAIWTNALNDASIVEQIAGLSESWTARKRLHEKSRQIVDGQGGLRVTRVLREELAKRQR